MWERYSRGVDVIVWVVDSADHDGLDIAREDMMGLLRRKSLYGIPCLIVGNKSDLEGSLDVAELRARLLVDGCDCRGGDDGDGDHRKEREIEVLKASCLTGEGIKAIVAWLGKKGR